MAALKGVNLGNWLVLEKWMHKDLFAGTTAEDETELCLQLGDDRFARLAKHRDTYITKADFEYLSKRGINTLRIPVPHFIFDDCPPYVGCIAYLDKAFTWAQETNLKILIDLHTVRDSQNGFDNGGICGVCKWHLNEENLNHTRWVLRELAKRYKGHTALFGLEFVNEPTRPDMFEAMERANRYPPHNKERAKGSCGVPDDVLIRFYQDCYRDLRDILGEDVPLVFHDGFRLFLWKDVFSSGDYKNLVLDTHLYVAFHEFEKGPEAFSKALEKTLKEFHTGIQEMRAYYPVIIGEWCFDYPEKGFGEADTPLMMEAAMRASAACQLYVFEQADGWFFWSYKLINGPRGWDYRKAIEMGWMPEKLS